MTALTFLQTLGAGQVTSVFLFASVTAVATGLGALPFIVVRRVSPQAAAYANAVASGLMLGATFGLVAEGSSQGVWQTLVGANLGVFFVLWASKFLEGRSIGLGELRAAGARRGLLVIVVMTAHSFAEGVAVGSAFAGSVSLATFVTVAIAVHNIPEGLAISAVLRPQGASLAACAGWSVFSSLPQPLMAVPSFLFVEAFRPALPYALGFAAGAMALMVLYDLLPEAFQDGRRHAVGLLVSTSLFAMILFQRLI